MPGKRLSLGLFLAATLWLSSCAPHDDSPLPDGVGANEPADKPEPRPEPARSRDHLRDRVDAALESVRRRQVFKEHSFWTIFHAMLGMGPENTYLFDPKTGQKEKAIDYICKGGSVRGLDFYPTPDGLDVRTMAGSGTGQGHQDQFVAEMVQWGLSPDRRFIVNGKPYKFSDFFSHSRQRARVTFKPDVPMTEKQELSWAIIIIGEHFGTDITWTNVAGEKLAFTDIVRYELNEPIIECPACGGTHRLFGLTWAYHRHRERGGKKDGIWKDVAETTRRFKQLARKYQNRDGSFSTDYFKGPGKVWNTQLRIGTTGHILEWLALALRDDELREPWVQKAVYALSQMILENRDNGLESGALYHAAHGLAIYRTRAFGTKGNGWQRSFSPVIPPAPKD
jgi:hypothetical protein